MGSVQIKAAELGEDGSTLTASGSYVFTATAYEGVEGAYVLAGEDPPGEACYMYVASGVLEKASAAPENTYWTYDPATGTLAYHDVSGEVITGGSATAITVGLAEESEAAYVTLYTGTEKPSKGGGGGGGGSKSNDPADNPDDGAPTIVSQPTVIHYVINPYDVADIGDGVNATTFTAMLPEDSTGTGITVQWYFNGEALRRERSRRGHRVRSSRRASGRPVRWPVSHLRRSDD